MSPHVHVLTHLQHSARRASEPARVRARAVREESLERRCRYVTSLYGYVTSLYGYVTSLYGYVTRHTGT